MKLQYIHSLIHPYIVAPVRSGATHQLHMYHGEIKLPLKTTDNEKEASDFDKNRWQPLALAATNLPKLEDIPSPS